MKVKIYLDTGDFGASYNEALLLRLCARNKMDVVEDASDADMLLVSMCDPSDLPLLVKARSESSGQPVIMGGFEGYFGEPYLAWADGVNVGEGFEFFKHVGKGGDWRDLPCILTRDKNATASYEIDWKSLPVVRTGKRKAYYLAGRGCHNKCKFCATSWVQPYRLNHVAALKRVSEQAGKKGCKVTFICNDSRDIPRAKNVNAASVTIKDYLKNPKAYKAGMLHFGIEGWTEQERRDYGKPVKDADIARLLKATKDNNQRIELFMISGKVGWDLSVAREFAAKLPQDVNHLPTVHVKLSYFDPCPHTPLSKESPATEYADIEKVFRIFNARNKRFRVFPCRSLARSNWRTVLHRCSPEQALKLGKEPTDTNTAESRLEWIGNLRSDIAALAGKIEKEPCGRINVRCKNDNR